MNIENQINQPQNGEKNEPNLWTKTANERDQQRQSLENKNYELLEARLRAIREKDMNVSSLKFEPEVVFSRK